MPEFSPLFLQYQIVLLMYKLLVAMVHPASAIYRSTSPSLATSYLGPYRAESFSNIEKDSSAQRSVDFEEGFEGFIGISNKSMTTRSYKLRFRGLRT